MLWKLDRSTSPPVLHVVDPQTLAFDPTRRRVILFPGAGLADHTGDVQGAEPYAGSIKYIEQTLSSSRANGEAPVDIFLYSYALPYDDFGAKKGPLRDGSPTHLVLWAAGL
jgi:hypothetical protein